jgi:hypothetical protein
MTMVAEVIQWMLLATFAVLLLGLYRQLAEFLQVERHDSVRSLGGPRLRRRLPAGLLTALAEAAPTFLGGEAGIIAFVSEGCVSCARLLSELQAGEPVEYTGRVAIVARAESGSYVAGLKELGLPLVIDSDGTLFRQCNVQATPLLLLMDRDQVVVRKAVDHNVTRALSVHEHS